jgi:hypothetical protein
VVVVDFERVARELDHGVVVLFVFFQVSHTKVHISMQ